MIAIVDILKAKSLYTFMAIKEQLILCIEEALRGTEYENKYGLSGSFTSTDQTISIVVGILAERQLMDYISSGAGSFVDGATPGFREYTYGVNITGINDEEVKSIARYLYYRIIDDIPNINREVRARIHSDLYVQPITASNVGEKRMWSINIFATAAINESYPPKTYPAEALSSGSGLDVDGYIPPGYSSCVIIREWKYDGEAPPAVTTPEATTTAEAPEDNP